MPRTTDDLVIGVLLSDFGPKRDGTVPSLTRFIKAANLLTSRVATCAASKGLTLSDEELAEIETWLAAHFYTQSDRPYSSTMTDRAQASYQGKTGMGLDSSHYGQTAINLDVSFCLSQINKQRRATASWLGKRPADATPYENR